MNKFEQMIAMIEDFDKMHRDDKSGGHYLVDALVRKYKWLEVSDTEYYVDALMHLTKTKSQELWGVAVETLSRIPDDRIGPELFGIVENWQEVDQYNDSIFLALTQIKYVQAAESCRKYVKEGLLQDRLSVIPILAALFKIDLQGYLLLSAEFFAKYQTQPDLLSRLLPAFMLNIIDYDVNIICKLIEYMEENNKNCSHVLKKQVAEYIKKPWVINKLCDKSLEYIRSAISNVSGNNCNN